MDELKQTIEELKREYDERISMLWVLIARGVSDKRLGDVSDNIRQLVEVDELKTYLEYIEMRTTSRQERMK